MKLQTHTATRDVTVQAVKDSPVIDMDNPSGTDQPYTGNNNTIDTVDKTVTFNEVQGADTAAMRRHLVRLFQNLRLDLKFCDGFSKCSGCEGWRPVTTSWPMSL